LGYRKEAARHDFGSGEWDFASLDPSASIKVREPAMNEFRNLYLLAGLRGGFERIASLEPYLAETALLHTLDHRWGVPPPWGPCDSGADLETPGEGVVRGWAHVDLRLSDESFQPSDVPLAGLLRTMWDALDLFGRCALTGLDAIVPLACAGEPMWRRVAGATIYHRAALEGSVRVALQITESYSDSPALKLDPETLAGGLSEFVEVGTTMGDVPLASYPDQSAKQPFGLAARAAPDANPNPLRVEVELGAWSIDDAAWLAEVMCVACTRMGCTDDVQIAVRRLG
jgi:hypothetical protein